MIVNYNFHIQGKHDCYLCADLIVRNVFRYQRGNQKP